MCNSKITIDEFIEAKKEELEKFRREWSEYYFRSSPDEETFEKIREDWDELFRERFE